MKKKSSFVLILFFFIVVVAICIACKQIPRTIPIQDIWVINLDKDKERWNAIVADTKHMRWMMHRWPATLGKDVTKSEARMEGVSQIMILKTDAPSKIYYKKNMIENNQGKVGCWLSHKRLMTYLSNLDLPEDHAHLIVEDDIHLHKGFLEEWEHISKKVPRDWDMVYLGITHPDLRKPINKPIYKGTTLHTTQGNWGMHAYLVRHGSLKSRILPKIQYLSHELDIQMNMHFDAMNVYFVYPNLLRLNEAQSSISSIELSKK